ncbi:MAG: DUF4389 domain-containing protein [Chloroflexota bacterium]
MSRPRGLSEQPTATPPPSVPPEAAQQLPPDSGHSEPTPETPPGISPEAAQQMPPGPEAPPTEPTPDDAGLIPLPEVAAEISPAREKRRYPVTLDFVGADRLSRLSTFFRVILMLPLALFVFMLGGTITSFTYVFGIGGGLITAIVVVHWITVLLRGRPVSWAWGTIVGMQRFILRSYSYIFLLTDRYPPFDGDWFLTYEVEKPARIRRRYLFIWKTLTSLPHFIVLSILWFFVAACEVFAWFAILFTGRFPRGLRNFVVGWLRWYARVTAYAMSLRDEFPPYSLSADAGPGSRWSQAGSGVAGIAIVAVIVVGVVAIITSITSSVSTDVNYATLSDGQPSATIDVSNVDVRLLQANDNYDFPGGLYSPDRGYRFVEFTVEMTDRKLANLIIDTSDFHLNGEAAFFASVQGSPPPRYFPPGYTGQTLVVFQLPTGVRPTDLTFQPDPGLKKAKFVFH